MSMQSYSPFAGVDMSRGCKFVTILCQIMTGMVFFFHEDTGPSTRPLLVCNLP